MIKIEQNQVFSDAGMQIRRRGSATPFSRGTILQGETEADFEEVDPEAAAPIDPAEYRAETERLIALRYSTGQEIQFAREKAEAEGYEEYLAYVEQCKAQARELLTAQATNPVIPDEDNDNP